MKEFDELSDDALYTLTLKGNTLALEELERRILGEGWETGCQEGQHEQTDMVISPPHYTYAKEKLGGLEVIDILEAFYPDEPLLWQVGKYLMRAGHKGPMLEDLQKARWYLDRRIAKEENDA